jgi:TolB-like protein
VLGQFVAEELITQISLSPKRFDIVERRQLARVLREQELSDSSLFDAASIAKIGKVLGIEAIVTGSIADLGTDIKINARVISVETAKVFAAASVKIKKTDTIQQMIGQLVDTSQSAPSQPSKTSPAHNRTAPAPTFFRNEFLKVEVSTAVVSKNKEQVTLSLHFQNIATHDILLALQGNSGRCLLQVADNLGNVASGERNTLNCTGLPCLANEQMTSAQSYLRFRPGERNAVVLTFGDYTTDFSGEVFTLSVNALNFDGSAPSAFKFVLSDIPLSRK